MPFISLMPMTHPRNLWRRLTARGLIVLILPTLLLASCSLSGLTAASQNGTPTGPDPCVGGSPAPTTSGDLGTPISGGTLTGAVDSNQPIHLDIALNINRQALDACLQAIYDPTSSYYRHFLNPTDIAQRFAPSATDIQKIVTYLQQQGLTVSQTYATNAALTVDGRAAQVEQAFNLQLQQYQNANGTFYSPDKSPTLPANLQGLISNISGLNSDTPLPCAVTGKCGYITHLGSIVTPLGGPTPSHVGVNGDCTFAITGTPIIGGGNGSPLLLWSDLRQAYGLNTLAAQGFDGGSTTIGMVEFDPYSRQDVQNYMLCAGTFDPNRLENVDVVPGLQPGSGVGEATLDVEMAAGMTSKTTKILTYNAPNNAQWEAEFQDILNRAASDKKVNVLSVSYGDFEQDLTPTYREAVNNTMQLLAAEGISTFVASGDCGAYGSGHFGAKMVDFPASAPWAIAVGGTQLTTDALGNRQSEVVWGNPSPDQTACNNTWGSGGGVSTEPSFTIPSWQKGPGVFNQYSTGARQVPDVAAAAINISIYYQGLWLMTGGTSAAAPIWASGMDVVNQALAAKGKAPMGAVPVIYQMADSSNGSKIFNDVTQGSNQYYSATSGWDFTSGWGSPNFDQIVTQLGG